MKCVVDVAFETIVSEIGDDKTRIWNSVELYSFYIEHGGRKLTHSKLTEMLCDRFADDLIVPSSPRYANIVVFGDKAAATLKMMKYDNEDAIDNSISTMAKQLIKECADMPYDKTEYDTNIDKYTAAESLPNTIQRLFECISSKFTSSLQAILVGNIITGFIKIILQSFRLL